ncbi:TetR family transcriptional regulator KstR2 [Amycolatopsis ultiminotia]|uniref:TetR family transcriptional regulator KstR2 n=1 Tax=Amycolatopsis ultiminotia TaxID=543629 RepID=A0ABP6X755_9PSEU
MSSVVVDERPLPLRARIQQVFTAFVAEHGFRGTALGDVAERLGISKGTILHHFKSKEALLARVGEDYIDRRERELRQILRRVQDPRERLIAFILSITLCHRDDLDATRVFGREFARYADSPHLNRVRERRRGYTHTVEEVIVAAMDAGVLCRDEPSVVALQIFGMCNWTWAWYQPEGPLTIEQIADRYVRTLLRGLGTAEAIAAEESVARSAWLRALVAESAALAWQGQAVREG